MGLGCSDPTAQARKPPSWYVPSAPGRPRGRRGCTSAVASDRSAKIVARTLAVVDKYDEDEAGSKRRDKHDDED